MIVELPYPPSMNTYWRKWNNRMVISNEGRAFKKDIAEMLERMKEYYIDKMKDRIQIAMVLYAPDKRKRDLDNVVKPVFDALKGILFEDDSQIDYFSIERGEVIKGNGKIVINIQYV